MCLSERRRKTGRVGIPSLAAACLVLTTGCTILQPVQTPQADRRFPLSGDAGKGTTPCTPINPATPGECQPLEEDIDAFHGGLGRALWETDLRRRELIGHAAEHTNINSAYNALLWPLGAYFIEKKIRRPSWSALDVAAIATASYGFLSSGIPDRDQLYVKTAARMACSMALFDADLYKKTEITPDRRRRAGVGDTLVERLDALDQAAMDFGARRDEVLVGLKLATQKTAPAGRTEADKRRLDALGLTRAAKAQKDPSKDFAFETEGLLVRAQDQLGAGRKLKQQLDDAGSRLRRQRIAIESALTRELNERTPALQQPSAVATQIAQAFEAGMTSERKLADRIKKESGTARGEDWLPTQANLADLDDSSRKDMIAFWTTERVALKQAMAALAAWSARHDERLRLARADASSVGCSDGDLAEFAKSLSKAAEGAGASTPTPPKPDAAK